MHISNKFRFRLSQLRERLWIKPLIACALSVAGVLLAHVADGLELDLHLVEIDQDSVIDLLKIVAGSMLGVATFAVASMVSAYASTGQSATARAFPLIVADDSSQNALSIFVAGFIFSIVALSAATNSYYGKAGTFTLFVLTLLVLALVVLVFVRWVDSIARLGRLGAVIERVEQAAVQAVRLRRQLPRLGGVESCSCDGGHPFHTGQSGHLQHVDMSALQDLAETRGWRIVLSCTPGTMVMPSRPLGYVVDEKGGNGEPVDPAPLLAAFTIGPLRRFDDDPRFGLIVLTEIGSRALSAAINDVGTVIAILGAVHRVLLEWTKPVAPTAPEYDSVSAPTLDIDDMFDDVFPPMARDGAGLIEVAARMQRVLGDLACTGDAAMRTAAERMATMALQRAERALDFPPDIERLHEEHARYWERDAAGAYRLRKAPHFPFPDRVNDV